MADNNPIPEINGKSFMTSTVIITVMLLAFAVVLLFTYSGRNAASIKAVRNFEDAPKSAELKAKDTEVLNSYGWVDQGNGVVRIPVSKAKELVVQKFKK